MDNKLKASMEVWKYGNKFVGQLPTVNRQPSTVNRQPSTVNRQLNL